MGVVGTVVVAVLQALRRDEPIELRVRVWLMTLGTAYALLVLASTGVAVFVVYARTVKPFLPFGCLLGGWAVWRVFGVRPRYLAAVASLAVLAALMNFRPHFGRVFPHEVEISVLRHFGNPKHTLSVSGSIYIPLAQPVVRPDLALVNAQLLYPVRAYLGFPAGGVILSLPHPLSYLPFQYESHTPRERDLLRSHDISMRLIRLSDPAVMPDDLPAALRYQNRDRPTGH